MDDLVGSLVGGVIGFAIVDRIRLARGRRIARRYANGQPIKLLTFIQRHDESNAISGRAVLHKTAPKIEWREDNTAAAQHLELINQLGIREVVGPRNSWAAATWLARAEDGSTIRISFLPHIGRALSAVLLAGQEPRQHRRRRRGDSS